MNGLPRLRVDVVSDVVCPWCVIGFATFERVVADFADRVQVTIHWQPFELNPDMPVEGEDIGAHVHRKYGASAAQGRDARERIMARAEAVGFPLRLADGMRLWNTFAAHQLIAWAEEQGDGSAVTRLMKALFTAHFVRHENVSRDDVLAAIAAEAGFDAAEAAAVLADGRYAAAVRARENHWREQGVQAVPALVFDERAVLTGAQDATLYVRILSRVADAR